MPLQVANSTKRTLVCQQGPKLCCLRRNHVAMVLEAPLPNVQGGLLLLEKSEAAKRAAARAERERAALDAGLKDAKVTGVLVVATLTAGAVAIGQVR